ncbi:MAG: 4-aminobutyrate aminotransferase-like enzyme/Ser/Thr protein kinase RdoA (MazF antagonist) [Saprospiraceae bacterium]|jgi:4-aminobutyrate aminotransferase-like enzyme/Ser/Thr protein kinase RdoA (MazF antagonist)
MDNLPFKDLVVSEAQAASLAKEYFNLNVSAKVLPGEVDFNFKLSGIDGTSYLLKVSRDDTSLKELQFQQSIIEHLSAQSLPFAIPSMLPNKRGAYITSLIDVHGTKRRLRLQSWVAGRMLADVNPRTRELYYCWGKTVGQLTKAFEGFDHEEAHRFYKWDPSETLYSRQYLEYIHKDQHKEIAIYFWNLFESETLPKVSHLRKGVNYNDAHEHNLLVGSNFANSTIDGVIDFGDVIYTHKINELAITCAYACMYVPDPLHATVEVIRGFHEQFKLREEELEVLYSLIAARLLITVSSAAWNRYQEPGNAYLSISEEPAWDLLEKWRDVAPALAHYTFRRSCGWEPCSKRGEFQNWLKSEMYIHSIIDFENKNTLELDLSVGSLMLGNNSNFLETQKFQRHINRILEDHEADVGVGGYGEIRPFYTSDAFQTNGNEGAQWRTVHLGIDLWSVAGTNVFAPLDGVVHSFANNKGDCNYGPTIILQHHISDALTFYTLYGHLSLDSIESLQVGQKIKKGSLVARIGSHEVNGNWPPHLHFQVMLDDLGMQGDFPGVAYPHDKDTWLSICPDPRMLIPELNRERAEEQIQDTAIIEIRKQILGPSLSISYDRPLHMVRGYGQYLYDINGRRYLDTVNNVAHVGHEHPRVVSAAQQQMALLNTNTRYLHQNIVRFAEALLETLPAELSVVHFVNSGSEANELALRMAKTCSRQRDMLAIEIGYHGNTGGCIDVSSYKFDGSGGVGSPDFTHILPIPDTYRGIHKNAKDPGREYSDYANSIIERVSKKGRGIAGFIGESIISCGGQVMLPEGYLKHIYRSVRDAGGLCIADEVQVGFGRIGKHFWGFELQDVVPDIVTMGKPIGNGHGLAAVVTTRAVADEFSNGMEYFNTFGGNPVSCAIGYEVLQVIKDEGLQGNALVVGNYLKEKLRELKREFEVIGDVRGEGLFLGFELVRDSVSLEPADLEASYLANRMRSRGILMSTDGPHHNVIKIKPPMIFTKVNADFLIENLRFVLKEDIFNFCTQVS